MKLPGHLCDSPGYNILRKSLIFTAEGQLTDGIHAEKLTAGILKYAADLSRRYVQLLPVGVQSIDTDLAIHCPLIKMGSKSVYHAAQRCLSTARFPAEQNALPIGYRQIYMGQNPVRSVGVAETKVFLFDHRITPNQERTSITKGTRQISSTAKS